MDIGTSECKIAATFASGVCDLIFLVVVFPITLRKTVGVIFGGGEGCAARVAAGGGFILV